MEYFRHSNVYDHEPFHYNPGFDQADVICEGSDEDETLELTEQKHLRYEIEAQRCAQGKLPILQSTILKGPLSPRWKNPWRHRSPKISHSTWNLASENTGMKFKALDNNETIVIGTARKDNINSAEIGSRVQEMDLLKDKPLDVPVRRKVKTPHDMVLHRDSFIIYTHGRTPKQEAKSLKRRREYQRPSDSRNSKRVKWNDDAFTSPTPRTRSRGAGRSKRLLVQSQQQHSYVSPNKAFLSISIPLSTQHAEVNNWLHRSRSFEPKVQNESVSSPTSPNSEQPKICFASKNKILNHNELKYNFSNSSVSSLISPVIASSEKLSYQFEEPSRTCVENKLMERKLSTSELTLSCVDNGSLVRNRPSHQHVMITTHENLTPDTEGLTSNCFNDQNYTTEYDSSSRGLDGFLFKRKRKQTTSKQESEYSNTKYNNKRRKFHCEDESLEEIKNSDSTRGIILPQNESEFSRPECVTKSDSISRKQSRKFSILQSETCLMDVPDAWQEKTTANIPTKNDAPDNNLSTCGLSLPNNHQNKTTRRSKSEPTPKNIVSACTHPHSQFHLSQSSIKNDISLRRMSLENNILPNDQQRRNLFADLLSKNALHKSTRDSQTLLLPFDKASLENLSACSSISEAPLSNFSEVDVSIINDSVFQSSQMPAITKILQTKISNSHSPNSSFNITSQSHKLLATKNHKSQVEKNPTMDETLDVDPYESDFGEDLQIRSYENSPTLKVPTRKTTVIETVKAGENGTEDLAYCKLNGSKHDQTPVSVIIQPELSGFKEKNKKEVLCTAIPYSQKGESKSPTSLVASIKKNEVSRSSSGDYPRSQSSTQTENVPENSKGYSTLGIATKSKASNVDPYPQSPWILDVSTESVVCHKNELDLQFSIGNSDIDIEPALIIPGNNSIVKSLAVPKDEENGGMSNTSQKEAERTNLSESGAFQTPQTTRQIDAQILYDSATRNPWRSVITKPSPMITSRQDSSKNLSQETLPIDQPVELKCLPDIVNQETTADCEKNDLVISISKSLCDPNDPFQEELPILFSSLRGSQESCSQNVSAMAEAFIAADYNVDREKSHNRQEQTGYLDLPSLAHDESFSITDIPELDVDALLGDMGEILEDWSVEVELNKI